MTGSDLTDILCIAFRASQTVTPAAQTMENRIVVVCSIVAFIFDVIAARNSDNCVNPLSFNCG